MLGSVLIGVHGFRVRQPLHSPSSVVQAHAPAEPDIIQVACCLSSCKRVEQSLQSPRTVLKPTRSLSGSSGTASS